MKDTTWDLWHLMDRLSLLLHEIGDWGSGDWISWDQNRWSKVFLIMRLTKFMTFHEIKSCNNDGISWSWHFSWEWKLLIRLLRLLRLLISWTICKPLVQSWDQKHLNLLSWTCGYFLPLTISHQCIKTFYLIIVLVTNKFFMRLKVKNNSF